MIRLISSPPMGAGIHRDGWPAVLSTLSEIASPDGILLDDYVERTYLHPPRELEDFVPREAWIGVFHYPPDVPAWFAREARLEGIQTIARWVAARRQLKLGIAFAPNIARWVRAEFAVPCLLLRHPATIPDLGWNEGRFRANPRKALIQAGTFLRNTAAIHQVRDCPAWLRRVHLRPEIQWSPLMDELCRRHWAPSRRLFSGVEIWSRLDNQKYDEALSQNLVFTELIAGGANNVVLECIARNAPIILNRSEAAEFYLGPGYPLFFDHFEHVADLLNVEQITRAHEWLKRMDKAWLERSFFRDTLRAQLAASEGIANSRIARADRD